MFSNKPIIGLAGGIGSGKSFVAGIFAESGCLVLDADEAVTQAYADPGIQAELRQWWGSKAFTASGQVDRGWIANCIFTNSNERQRLENLLHPRVEDLRQKKMEQFANNSAILAFVWDVPLLFETGQDRHCDAIVYVDSPLSQRIARVHARRGWDEKELIRRENLQLPLDKKRQMSDYVVVNAVDAAETRQQVRDVLSKILQNSKLK